MNNQITEQTAAPKSAAQVVEVLPPDPRALNAQTHGLGTEHISPDEQAAYTQHAQQIREAVGAQTYLEQRLADRAALALWRLDRVARYEAAQVSQAQRVLLGEVAKGEPHGPAFTVLGAYEQLRALMPWETVQSLRDNPQRVDDEAQDLEQRGAFLLGIAQGGSAEGLDVNQCECLGSALYELLSMVKVPPAQMVRAMMGRPPKRGEVQSLESDNWEYEPDEVPALLAFYRERFTNLAPSLLEGQAAKQVYKAGKLRAALAAARAAERDALALVALGRDDVLTKVMRYEAHLERTLYRALHDLEAMTGKRQGEQVAPPLRGVLDDG